MKTCSKCNHKNPDKAMYCMNCGSLLKEKDKMIKCKYCGHVNPADAEFCGKCGNTLKEEDYDNLDLSESVFGEKIKCKVCGFDNRSSSHYCSRCGSKLEKKKITPIFEQTENDAANKVSTIPKRENKKIEKKSNGTNNTFKANDDKKDKNTDSSNRLILYVGCCAVFLILFLVVLGGNVTETISDESDNIPYENINMTNIDMSYTNASGENFGFYQYYLSCDLNNVSPSLRDGKVIVYFYDEDGKLLENNFAEFTNNTTITINDHYGSLNDYHTVHIHAALSREDLINITSYQILIIKDNNIVFNQTKPYKMNLKNYD